MNIFDERLAAVDRGLKGGPPAPEPPAGLHESVMRAVRGSASFPAPSPVRSWRWAGAAGVLCLVFFGLWGGSVWLRSRIAPSPFNSVASARINQQMTELPSMVLSPLSQEWQSLNADLEKTAEFLLASVP